MPGRSFVIGRLAQARASAGESPRPQPPEGDPHQGLRHDPGMHLYQTRWNGKPVSELKIKAAPVVKATAPFARYDVQLVLNNWPGK